MGHIIWLDMIWYAYGTMRYEMRRYGMIWYYTMIWYDCVFYLMFNIQFGFDMCIFIYIINTAIYETPYLTWYDAMG